MAVFNYVDADGKDAYAKNGETFEKFLDLLKELGDVEQTELTVHSWAGVAETLGVSQTTIFKWLQSKEARFHLAKGIHYGLERMTETGKDDWRMWREYLKMIGWNPVEKKDITSNGEQIDGIIVKIVNSKDDITDVGDASLAENGRDGEEQKNNIT